MNYYFKKSLQSIDSSIVKTMLGVLLLFVTAQIYIPLEPVPITVQTCGLVVIALCYSTKEARQTVVWYVILGAAGVPVFAQYSGGLQIIFGPRGGYILGFIACVFAISFLREKFEARSWLVLVVYSIIGTCSIFCIAVPWLAYFVGVDKSIQVGIIPFIIPGLVKACITAALIHLVRRV